MGGGRGVNFGVRVCVLAGGGGRWRLIRLKEKYCSRLGWISQSRKQLGQLQLSNEQLKIANPNINKPCRGAYLRGGGRGREVS